jgi:hypothetical protein
MPMAVIALAPDPLVFPYFAVAARFDLTGRSASRDLMEGLMITNATDDALSTWKN